MPVQVSVVYYEITFQTRAFKLDQSYIADLASIIDRGSEGQCKEHCLVLAPSVFNQVGQAGERQTVLLMGYVVN